MQELIEYYKINICPFCTNHNTNQCTEEIIKNNNEDLKKVSCKNYNTEIKRDSEMKVRHLYTLPKKYYSKNMKEV